MSLTNPSVGLQRDDDTLALYKSIREFAPDIGAGVYATGIADSAGNYPLEGNAIPRITNGPLGDAGWQLDPPQFARSFCDDLAGFVHGTTDIDQDYNDAIRADFTQQFMFRFEWDHTELRGIYGANNEVGTGASNDWLARISVTASGHLEAFWESNDANFNRITTSTAQGSPPIQIAKWQVLTVVWVPGASGYEISFYIHTLDSPGVVTGGLIESFADHGLLPLSTSGLGDSRITYGRSDRGGGDRPLIGPIAFGRIVKAALNATQIGDQAEELLTTGKLASQTLTNDLHRHEFNEPPDWLDEGPFGLHADAAMVVDRDTRKHHIDLLGSSGRSRRNASSGKARIGHLMQARSMGAVHGTDRLSDFFNDTFFAVPEYTFQFWGIVRSGATSEVTIAQWEATGETLATNFLFRYNLDVSTGDVNFFAERGSGVDIGRANVSLMGAWGTDLTEQSVLLTIRAGEKDGSPGVMQVRVSVNDDLDAISYDLSTGIPAGGTDGVGINWGWPNEGQLQEFKWSLGMISDQQILDDFARIIDREGSAGAAAPPTVPPLSSLAPGSFDGGIPFSIRS